ncbi:GM25926 [Drosophila sechellia]|uniref:GM25926 n=1 Tax=Drosophila sechellia TaxID=7238 RepID=B4HFR5_DROSE|nr:GM25926 [Drosophila sechellia]
MKCHCDRATALQRNQFGGASCASSAAGNGRTQRIPRTRPEGLARTTHLHALLQLELQRWWRTYSAL